MATALGRIFRRAGDGFVTAIRWTSRYGQAPGHKGDAAPGDARLVKAAGHTGKRA